MHHLHHHDLSDGGLQKQIEKLYGPHVAPGLCAASILAALRRAFDDKSPTAIENYRICGLSTLQIEHETGGSTHSSAIYVSLTACYLLRMHRIILLTVCHKTTCTAESFTRRTGRCMQTPCFAHRPLTHCLLFFCPIARLICRLQWQAKFYRCTST